MDIDLTSIDFEGPLAQRGIGIIAPFDLALERELWRWAPLDVSYHLARTPYEEISVSLAMAELVSERRHVQSATRDVLGVDPQVVAYLCTSGSFIHGVAGEAALRQTILDAGAPDAVTTSGALMEAVRELELSRISVITPYDAALTERLNGFLAELGVAVTRSEYLGLGGGIWRVNYRTVADLEEQLKDNTKQERRAIREAEKVGWTPAQIKRFMKPPRTQNKSQSKLSVHDTSSPEQSPTEHR